MSASHPQGSRGISRRGGLQAGRHQRSHLRSSRHRRAQRHEPVIRGGRQRGPHAAESLRTGAVALWRSQDSDNWIPDTAALQETPSAERHGQRAERRADPRQRHPRRRLKIRRVSTAGPSQEPAMCTSRCLYAAFSMTWVSQPPPLRPTWDSGQPNSIREPRDPVPGR